MALRNPVAIKHISAIMDMCQPYSEDGVYKKIPESVYGYLETNGIPEPKAKNDHGYVMRLLCLRWWNRTLNKMKNTGYESSQIQAGKVAKKRQIYCTNTALNRAKESAAASAEFINSMVMVADDGEVLEMINIVKGSLSNPYNRRSELMVRMAGFEVYAYEHGDVGEFYTFTTPSKFHRFSGHSQNENYQGLSPKDAQQHLVLMWSRIRALLAKHKINVYGFRVAEPHHDACPHWHMLLFMKPDHREKAREIMSTCLLEVDGDEPGADKHRFVYKEIDKDFGTATGYIAKYISKNLGYSVDDTQLDATDKSTEYGQRVKAWSSLWGIRQFQQIGGAPVGVWRQLRKIDEQSDELLEAARLAAAGSQWGEFVKLMGGVNIKRADRPIQPYKSEEFKESTGDVKTNSYGEVIKAIYGLLCSGLIVVVKLRSWILLNKSEAIAAAAGGVAPAAPSWSPLINCNPSGLLNA